ncbi:MAG: biotin-dependent carboxyltransferase family protein [Xanthobacteraceae bacterium]|nr:biotin-dependent carboxyltransferase family protein [Xanthobacteraceae bacterium]
MSFLEVTSAGIATSIQDAGRLGLQRYGLVPSGAMDRLSLAAANALVGNSAFAAAIEIGPQGAIFSAHRSVRVAVAGATRAADVNGHGRRMYHSMLLADGERLTLGAARDGVFGYLAVEGGIKGELMFNSLSVNARAGLGSPFPRPLQNGDRLEVGTPAPDARERTLQLPPASHSSIRVVMGPQDDEFGEACTTFLDSEWRISSSSDRMGYRLEGPKLRHAHDHNIVSDGTVDGSIQVSGNGQPIVLMKDRGTTGGYPKIATVITADLGRLAQTRFGRSFRFEAVSVEDAQAEARAFQNILHALPGMAHDASEANPDKRR